jgi:RNA polymerase sigma-70 factor (ECF subfamily)
MIVTDGIEKISDQYSQAQAAASENQRLVRAIEQRDPDAESTFVERYLKPVRTLLLARSRNPDLTADLQQEVMLEALCALRSGQLREPEKLSAFVAGIARNKLNNHFRSNRPTEPLHLPDELPDLSCVAYQAEQEQREQLAGDAIASLDPLDRSILQMTLLDGLKPGVIAQRLQLSPDVVRQRKLRATRRVIEIVRGLSQSSSSNHRYPGKV